MPDYTKVNLKGDVQDMAPQFGFAPDVEARFARENLGLEHSGISYQRVAPGFRMPFGHRHAEQEEVYVFLSGGGRLKLDDELVDVAQWDAVRIPAAVMRAFEAGPDGAELLAFGAPFKEKNDAEMQPGWWAND